MPKYDLECLYCGKRWQATFWSDQYLNTLSCTNQKCNDKNIKVRELDEAHRDVFGYNFDPKVKKKSYY